MLDQSTRTAILKLEQQGHSIRGIARAMKLSRGAVRQVLRSASEIVPRLVRAEKATPYREQILELYARCKGNLVRVHEERSEEHTSELQSHHDLVCRLLLEKKKKKVIKTPSRKKQKTTQHE